MPDDNRFEAFGLKVPMPKWAASLLALIVVIGVGVGIYQKLYSDPQRAVLTLKEVNDQLAVDIEEYGRHAMEEPTKHELFEDTDGSLALRVYSDHCVLIQRKTRDGMRTRLVPDLAKSAMPKRASFHIVPPSDDWLTVHAAAGCSGGCVNPHPGPFQWWYGATLPNGWMQVWRRWPEGCTHWQAFHPQSGTWATNRDGSPAVNWTCCVH